MTREEYLAKLKGLHPQMDCDLEWKYTQEYITSLEARIAELEADTPYLAIGNEELGTPVSEGDIVAVTIDGTCHEGAVKFGDRIVDGERIKSNTIGAIRITDGRVILVAISGRLLSGVTLIERMK